MLCAGQTVLGKTATPFLSAATASSVRTLQEVDPRVRARHHGNNAPSNSFADQKPQVLGVIGSQGGSEVFASVRRFFAGARELAQSVVLSTEFQHGLFFASAVAVPIIGVALAQGSLAALAAHAGAQLAVLPPALPPELPRLPEISRSLDDSIPSKAVVATIEALTPGLRNNKEIYARVLELSSVREMRGAVREAAAKAIAANEPAGRPLSNEVLGLLNDHSHSVRMSAASGLLARAGEVPVRNEILKAMREYFGADFAWEAAFRNFSSNRKVTDLIIQFLEGHVTEEDAFATGEEGLIRVLSPLSVARPGAAEVLAKIMLLAKPRLSSNTWGQRAQNSAAKQAASLLFVGLKYVPAKRRTAILEFLTGEMLSKIEL